MKDWPYEAHPTGWYQVAFSGDLAPGDVRPVKYFGEDLVLFRTTDGTAGILDAYCPHLGAHLGYGGTAHDGCIQCPWHGWKWSPEGVNVEIPYLDKPTDRGTAKAWEVREIQDMVLTWYDALGREPFWEFPGLPEFEDTENFYPIWPDCCEDFGHRAIKPQSPLENTPDYHHFVFVHGAGQAAEPVMFETEGHYLHAKSKMRFGVGRESTWLTPNGPADCFIETEGWGLGMGLARMCFPDHTAAHLINCTPVDDEMSHLFTLCAVSRVEGDSGDVPSDRASKMVAAQNDQIANDFDIWENQRFVQNPLYAGKEERAYAKFRRWTEQFYPDLTDA